jgi:hypothetical protein
MNKKFDYFLETNVITRLENKKINHNLDLIKEFNFRFGDSFCNSLLENKIELVSNTDLLQEFNDFKKNILFNRFYKRQVFNKLKRIIGVLS